jgi:hypothetical protein
VYEIEIFMNVLLCHHMMLLNILMLQPDVQIHDISDKDVKNLEKKFKEGSMLRIRILGVRHLEGVAVGTVKVTSGHFS